MGKLLHSDEINNIRTMYNLRNLSSSRRQTSFGDNRCQVDVSEDIRYGYSCNFNRSPRNNVF